mgnify:FL=1|jgi:TP901-1 family phage major tail protein
MPSTGINNGTLIALYKDSVKITNLTSNNISLSMATRDATTKDSAGWETVLEGLRSGEFSCEGYFDEAATEGFTQLYAEFLARTTFVARFSSEVTGDKYYEGAVYVTSLESSAGTEESQTFSCSLKLTGAITTGAVTP